MVAAGSAGRRRPPCPGIGRGDATQTTTARRGRWAETTTTRPTPGWRGPEAPTPRAPTMELDDETAREITRAVQDIGTRTRADSLENMKYAAALSDGVRAELRRELAARMDALERKQQHE